MQLGTHHHRLPATPAEVLAVFAGRAPVRVVPEVQLSGARGPSAFLFAGDGSGLMAWIPAFGADAVAASPDGIAHWVAQGRISCALVGGTADDLARMPGPTGGDEVQPWRVPLIFIAEELPAPEVIQAAEPIAPAEPTMSLTPKARPAPRPAQAVRAGGDWSQLELFA